MALGPGKYDKLCTWVRERAKAQGVILIVLDGEKGSGFSAQLRVANDMESARLTAEFLRQVAAQIEADSGVTDA